MRKRYTWDPEQWEQTGTLIAELYRLLYGLSLTPDAFIPGRKQLTPAEIKKIRKHEQNQTEKYFARRAGEVE